MYTYPSKHISLVNVLLHVLYFLFVVSCYPLLAFFIFPEKYSATGRHEKLENEIYRQMDSVSNLTLFVR